MKNIDKIIEMMKELNPKIKMDKVFKKSLKNKLEVINYAKIKNTKNKKINVAEKGFFSFKKNNSNIFDKPKFNFLKLLSPIFIGAFAVFGFVNFYGQDLFINNGDNINYEVEKLIDIKKVEEKKSKTEEKNIKTEEKNSSDIKIIKKKNINKLEKKDNKFIEKKVENKIKYKTKKIVEEKEIIKKEELPISKKENIVPQISNDDIIKNKTIIEKKENSLNTEIIDLLGDDINTENDELLENDYGINESDSVISNDNGFLEDNIEEDNIEATMAEETTLIEKSEFEIFCEEKKGIIKNDICEYGKLKCSKVDFENNKCN